jgi:hypothetical protein
MCASKRSRNEIFPDENSNQMKKRCLWSLAEEEEESETGEEKREGEEIHDTEYEDEDENMEQESFPNIHEIKLNGLPFDGVYPRKPKFGRKIDSLIDDVIRKSQRLTEKQNSYALIPTPDTTIWIPSAIGPHPCTDQRYLSRNSNPQSSLEEIEHAEAQPQSRSETTTHSDWFICTNDEPDPWDGSSSRQEESSSSSPSSSSDECEDMAVIP